MSFFTNHIKLRDSIRTDAPPAIAESMELPPGHRKNPGFRAFSSATIFDKNQILTLRDGVKIRADIFRPKGDAKVPGIIMYGPYGKSNSGPINLDFMPLRAGIPQSSQSGYENFEGLDPAEWVPRGYAIINVDARGTAEQPPHLLAIAPLEGTSDELREHSFRGGIPSTGFAKMIAGALPGRGKQEDWVAAIESTITTNDYLEDKRVDFSKIKVPTYIGASYSSDLHTIGSLRAFEEIPHKDKWLSLHATQEWYDLYSPNRTEDLCKFFDRYLKGVDNGWEGTVPVRLALLTYTGSPIVDRPFLDLPWHLPSADRDVLHLTHFGGMSKSKPSSPERLSYNSESSEKLEFTHTFTSRVALVGPSTLVIDVSSPNQDDLDIYTHIFKASADGTMLTHLNVPVPDSVPQDIVAKATENRIFKYWGPNGMLRASHRHVSRQKSGKTWNTLSHEKVQKVQPGTIVRLEIQLWPTGIIFEAGENLVLKISGEEIGVPALPQLPKTTGINKGNHVVHVGGDFEARLDIFTIDA
ncbi:Alpha/Beta hydrolase protein [Bipolaris maydis]|nr:Alpha/Beta hydrolase protein [Bipolaris maydis]KAJ6212303.1 Alpha/Beta hydrolase protein [Bipolaris maydis]